MAHIKELSKEEYIKYVQARGSIDMSYYLCFIVLTTLMSAIGLQAYVNGVTISDYIAMGLLMVALIVNLTWALMSFRHLKKLFVIDKASFLN